MIDLSFPYPPLKPLERLHVYDSLTVNADRWRLAHDYHRSRQNLVHQSLNQPGIIYGLGVKVIDPPLTSSKKFRDIDQQCGERRWLEIQPGMAIDIAGNPIIVDDALEPSNRAYRIAASPPTTGEQTIYVVVSYVEPEPADDRQETPLLEQFRFDQKTQEPLDHEVELCRIQIKPGGISLTTPVDPFNPKVNEIDLRYRLQAQARPQSYVRVGIVNPLPRKTGDNLRSLQQSLPGLFAMLQAEILSLDKFGNGQLEDYDLLYITPDKLSKLDTPGRTALQSYLETGGSMLVEAESPQYIRDWLGTAYSWNGLSSQHPLRSHPFLFTQLPPFYNCPTEIMLNEGVICLTGRLTDAWSGQENLSRSEIREAHELGINILHYAWRRRHLKQLLQ
jgi:hypothetical protein